MPIVSSIILQGIIQFAAQYSIYSILNHQKWYKNYCYVDDDYVAPCFDNSVKKNFNYFRQYF